MFKSLHPFRILIGWFLLATFCLHLTGCYSQTMIPLDKIQDAGNGKTIVIRYDNAEGILKNPSITSTSIEGELSNPFVKPYGDKMPLKSDQIILHLKNKYADLLFKAGDTTSSPKSFSVPRTSVMDTGLVYHFSAGKTVVLAVGIPLGIIAAFGILFAATWKGPFGGKSGSGSGEGPGGL